MSGWLNRLRFLWEEEMAPPGEAHRDSSEEPAGVPRPLRLAARFILIGGAAVAMISQIIQVRLIAPVDASPSYVAQCIQANCKRLTGLARAECNHRCQEAAAPLGGTSGGNSSSRDGRKGTIKGGNRSGRIGQPYSTR